MPLFRHLPIMPKEVKTPMSTHASASAPYPTPTSAGPRTAGIWSTADDEILLRARAGGKNWQPISDTYFPNKSANACRKRHERLVEKRQGEDWDALKLELLAQEYMAVRKQMWEILASRVDERWSVVEAKVSLERIPQSSPTTNDRFSVWRRVSRIFKRPLVRRTERQPQGLMTHSMIKVLQTIIPIRV